MNTWIEARKSEHLKVLLGVMAVHAGLLIWLLNSSILQNQTAPADPPPSLKIVTVELFTPPVIPPVGPSSDTPAFQPSAAPTSRQPAVNNLPVPLKSAKVPTRQKPLAPIPLPDEKPQAASNHQQSTTSATAPGPLATTGISERGITGSTAPSTQSSGSGKQSSAAGAPPAGNDSSSAGAAISAPRFGAAYLNNPAPKYPAAAKRMGEEGAVMLRVLVSPDGGAKDVRLHRSSGSADLDDAALKAVRRWRFIPAKQGSTPVEAWVQVPIVFKLD